MQYLYSTNWDLNTTPPPHQRSLADVTILLDSNKNVLYANAAYTSTTTGPTVNGVTALGLNIRGYCAGQAYQQATSTPVGATPSLYFNIAKFDPVTGFMAFAATYLYGSQIDAQGINVFGSLKAGSAVWNPASPPVVEMNCLADNDSTDLKNWDSAFQSNLGYSYPTGAGNAYPEAPGYNSIQMVKVVDPGNLLGWGSGCSSGICGTYP